MTWKQIERIRKRLAKERGTIYKEWGGRLRVVLTFPNTYYVGMSSLALNVMYRAFNSHPDVVCERTFWEKQEAEAGWPLLSFESQRPVTDADIFAFTISYEMDYFNLADMLRQAHIPILAEERLRTRQYDGRPWPLLLAGGPAMSMNPEPVAPFFDAIVIGEGEDVIHTIVELVREHEPDREATLQALAQVPGVYVPALHPADPTHPDFRPIERLWARDVTRIPPTTAILTPDTEFGNMYLIEIARGCGRACRFCLAGYIYRPPREQPLDQVLAWAREGLAHTDRIGLVSAAVSDYSHIDELAVRLREMGARISVSSMRTDPISVPLVKALAESGTRTLTIAPEAGSQRLRDVISKTQRVEDLMAAVDLAESLRFPQLKLYFMVGHPTERDEDIEDLIRFVKEVRGRFRRNLIINATPFVPKPHTPFQWVAMTPAEIIKQRQKRIARALARHNVVVRADNPLWAAVQGVLARGDRRLAPVLAGLERLTPRAFFQALERAGLSAAEYLGERVPGEPLPWAVVDPAVRTKYLLREWRLAQQARTGRECPPQAKNCLTCGACDMDWAFRDGGIPLPKPHGAANGSPMPIPLVDRV